VTVRRSRLAIVLAMASILLGLAGAWLGLEGSAGHTATGASGRREPPFGAAHDGAGGEGPGAASPTPSTSGFPLVIGRLHYLRDGRWVAAAVGVRNQNRDVWVPNSEVLFLAVDASGRVIGRFQSLVSLGPGQSRTVVAQSIELESPRVKLDSVQVTLTPGPWQPISTFRPPNLHISRIRVVTRGHGVSVTGDVSNRRREEVYAQVFCALWDGHGRFAGAGLAYAEPKGSGSTPFVMPVDHFGHEPRTATCYVGLQ
jgi:hypothetical protein